MKPDELARYIVNRLAAEALRRKLLSRPGLPRGQHTPAQEFKIRLMAEYDQKKRLLKFVP